jgi:hypothetical protein
MLVMPGLVPGIHVLETAAVKGVDGWDKPGHDAAIVGALDSIAISVPNCAIEHTRRPAPQGGSS